MTHQLYIAKNNEWTRFGRPSVANDAFVEGWGLPAFQDEFETPGAPNPAKWNVRDRSTFGLLNDASIIEDTQCVVNATGQVEIRGEWLASGLRENTTTGPQGNPTLRAMKTGYMEHRLAGGGTIYEQRYGMWQYKVKIPMAPDVSLGTLGAVWLRNSKTGEIDMTEGWGSGPTTAAKPGWYPAQPKPNAGRTAFTIHQSTSGGGTKEAWTQSGPVYDEWVEYRFIYTPNRFEFYRKRASDSDWVAQFLITPTSFFMLPGTFSGATPSSQSYFAKFWTDTAAYDAPWHLRMNLHIGPSVDFWGVPEPLHEEWTANPVMQVEYVRIYPYVP